uniref:Uncharacterized protein n=1 Tax=Eptatretus burgeri TaxID=7764 RepID=A0A8C4R7D7_EPTBU
MMKLILGISLCHCRQIRREGMRLLLLWMQALQQNCTSEEILIFACLVPGFPPPIGPGGPCTLEDLVCKALSEGPVIAEEVTPLVQPQSSDFAPDDLTCYFLEILLNLMVRQSMGFEWRKKENQDKGFSFLFGCFKKYYLPALFPSFCALTSFYNPDPGMLHARLCTRSQ